MGSSASTSRSNTPTQTRSATPSRNTNFREVQFEQSGGAPSARRPQALTPRAQHSTNNDHARMSRPEGFSDLSVVAGQMRREKTVITENEQPKYGKDDMVLESFYHRNDNSYTCLYQNGNRYYLHQETWRPFPREWYKEGILVTDRFITDNELTSSSGSQATSASGSQATSASGGQQKNDDDVDDRAGFLIHPTRGKLQTYVFEEKRNVNYFFDKKLGSWVRLPIAWELHCEITQRLLAPIQEALPEWKDQHDVLAALRASNYDPQECVNTYLAIGEHDALKSARTASDFLLLQEKDDQIRELSQELETLRMQFTKSQKTVAAENAERKSVEKQLQELQDQFSTLEVTAAANQARLEAVLTERPKTARPPSVRAKTPAPVRTPSPVNQVDPDTVVALNTTMMQLHKTHIKLKMESKQKFSELQALMKQMSVGVMKIKLSDSSQSGELEQLRELYRKESLQRKLLYNKLQELRGNIRVFCRCRYDNRTKCCLQFPNDGEVLTPGAKKGMKFDKVFSPKSTQEEVYKEAEPIITSCVDGYNVCILAYGQTGSGKTFTMQGPPDDPGVNVRALQELLKICDEKESVDYTLKSSMVEIYNETIVDLLRSDTKTLDIRAQGNKIVLPGVTEMEVTTLNDIEKIIKLGQRNRSTAATKMNSQSSRSHLIFMISVEGRDRASGAVTSGTLTLCDLAGSERVGKTEATGQRLVEAAAINKSLSSLGQVFTALRTGQLHVPFRNSKLTHILQPSLSGDAKACLFVAVSPDESNILETTSTLQFGSNARQVALGQAKQNIKQTMPVGFSDMHA